MTEPGHNAKSDSWFETICRSCNVDQNILDDLIQTGFVVIPGPVGSDQVASLAESFDMAIAMAEPDDVRVGSTTTRVNDLVNRGPAFDTLYVFPPLLKLCCGILGQPFKLSTMMARTVRPGMPPQSLHVDFERKGEAWPMVGFIIMIDEFESGNGATQFIPGSHYYPAGYQLQPDAPPALSACGPAGSMIVYNGSAWHGHGANTTAKPRRSIQGAFILRHEISGADLPARMLPKTLERISPLALYLINV